MWSSTAGRWSAHVLASGGGGRGGGIGRGVGATARSFAQIRTSTTTTTTTTTTMTASHLPSSLSAGVPLASSPTTTTTWGALGARNTAGQKLRPRMMMQQRGLAHVTEAEATAAGSASSRGIPPETKKWSARNRNAGLWMASILVGFLGLSYAAVPLYRMFCQVTGFGGTVQESVSGVQFSTPSDKTTIMMDARPLTIQFSSNVASNLPWSFVPEQMSVEVRPGETTLAFYRAKNRTKKAITGVATYNVQPNKVGIYFNKIQCFCFEEQQLRALEEVDMPVFFFIDPEFTEDPRMDDVREILLSYTFFRTEDVDVEEAQRQLAQ